jgi:hypothetical protein
MWILSSDQEVMLISAQQLRAIPINANALELVPESVARENSVLATSIRDGLLHLVIPSLTDIQICLLQDKLQFILDRAFSYDTTDSPELSQVIDLHYTAAYSTVQNCGQAFRIRCPKQWAELAQTENPAARWCSVCERTVTFCQTDADVQRLSRAGECVAFYDGRGHADALGLLEYRD